MLFTIDERQKGNIDSNCVSIALAIDVAKLVHSHIREVVRPCGLALVRLFVRSFSSSVYQSRPGLVNLVIEIDGWRGCLAFHSFSLPFSFILLFVYDSLFAYGRQ